VPEALIIDGVRTPIGRYGGPLAPTRAADLAALVVAEVVSCAGVGPALVDEVILGAFAPGKLGRKTEGGLYTWPTS
jgi:acetyl-CoA acetyltransferase